MIKNFVQSKKFKNFMAKLYGFGAAIVIIGALFKINHYPGAAIMLIVGLGTEATIFFFSAFEPPHQEPDWSLVYPELAGMVDEELKEELHNVKRGKFEMGDSVSQELDKMLSDAKIGPELIESLGNSFRNLSENTSKFADITKATVATDQYVQNMQGASTQVGKLSETFKKTTEILEKDAVVTEKYATNMENTVNTVSQLNDAYKNTANSINSTLKSNEEFSKSVQGAIGSLNDLKQKYITSSEMLEKSAKAIDFSSIDGNSYNEQLTKISKNLAALNAVYELQLQGSNEQLQKTQLAQQEMVSFMQSLKNSTDNTQKLQGEIASLTQNIAALNKVYGNMLSAMSISK